MAEQTCEFDHMVRKLGARIEQMTSTELAHTYFHLFGEQRLTPHCPEQARAEVLEELVARSAHTVGAP